MTYQWRTLTANDADAFTALYNACLAVDGETAVAWQSHEALTTRDNLRHVGAFAANGALMAVGYAQLNADTVVLETKVHPDQRAANLEQDLLHHLAATVADVTMAKRIIRNEAFQPASQALYESLGYTCDFVEWRMRLSTDSPLPTPNPNLTYQAWSDDTAHQFFALYAASFAERMNGTSPDEAAWIADHTEDDEFSAELSLVAYLAGEAVGFVTMFVWGEPTKAYLSQIGTLPSVRGQGVSVAMMANIVAKLRAAGVTHLDLHVNENNPRAIAVYEKFGFKIFGKRSRFSQPSA